MQKHSTCAGYKRARALLQDDFISPQEIMLSRAGIAYTHEQLEMFCNLLPSPEEIEACHEDNAILMAGPAHPLSLIAIRKLKRSYFYSEQGGWYARQPFAKNETVQPSWISLPKELVVDVLSIQSTSPQLISLSDLYTLPNAAEVAWCLTTYHAVRGVYLLPEFYVRTSSMSSDGRHVGIGSFNEEGLDIARYKDL